MSHQATTETTLSPLMTRDEVLQVTSVCLSTLYAWMNAGYFPACRSLGPKRSNGYAGRSVWSRAEVNAWLVEHMAKPGTVGPTAKSGHGASQPA
ncbi:AlpA family phage regulatory protein [Pseudomonas chlororaphis]|nr:AlpA family phage regulatory protein [Pseudomonas chlororaphis]